MDVLVACFERRPVKQVGTLATACWRSRVRQGWLCRAIALGTLAAQPVGAAAAQPAVDGQSSRIDRYFSDLLIGVHKSSLKSGLKVVLHADRSLPLVALSTSYATGHSSESPAAGISMPLVADYARRRKLDPPHHPDYALLRARAARSSSDVDWEYTSFNQVMPSSELDFGLWLEAQRLQALSAAELRNSLTAPLPEPVLSLLHPERTAYRWFRRFMSGDPPSNQLQSFGQILNQRFFTARSAVLTIVGDFEPDTVRDSLSNYLGPIISGRPDLTPGARASTPAPSADAPIRHEPIRHDEPRHAQEEVLKSGGFHGIIMGFDAPPVTQRDHWALQVAAQLLNFSEGDRKGTAFMAAADANDFEAWLSDGGTTGSVFTILMGLDSRANMAHAQALLTQRLQRLKAMPPSASEFEHAKRRALVAWLERFVSIEQRAALLGRYEVIHGDARLVTSRHVELLKLTPKDVWRVAKAILENDRAFVFSTRSPSSKRP